MGVVFGPSLVRLFALLPSSILGVMLVLSGMELCSAIKDIGVGGFAIAARVESPVNAEGLPLPLPPAKISVEEARRASSDVAVMCLTAGTVLGFSNDGVGFLCGCVGAAFFAVREKMDKGEGFKLDGRGAWQKLVTVYRESDGKTEKN